MDTEKKIYIIAMNAWFSGYGEEIYVVGVATTHEKAEEIVDYIADHAAEIADECMVGYEEDVEEFIECAKNKQLCYIIKTCADEVNVRYLGGYVE